MKLSVRRALPDDIPALQDLIRASVLQLQAADYTPEQLHQLCSASSASILS